MISTQVTPASVSSVPSIKGDEKDANLALDLSRHFDKEELKSLDPANYQISVSGTYCEIVYLFRTALDLVYQTYEVEKDLALTRVLFAKIQVILADPNLIFSDRYLKQLFLVLPEDQIGKGKEFDQKVNMQRIRLVKILSPPPSGFNEEDFELGYSGLKKFLVLIDEIQELIQGQTDYDAFYDLTYDKTQFTPQEYERIQIEYLGPLAPCFTNLVSKSLDLEFSQSFKQTRTLIQIFCDLIRDFEDENVKKPLALSFGDLKIKAEELKDISDILTQTGVFPAISQIKFSI